MSCLVSLSLSLSVPLCFCLLSLSLSLFLSVSVSVSLCLRVVLCVVVLCGVCGVLCVWCGVWRGLARRKKPPCVDSNRPRVYRHHAHMCYHMCAWCRYTRRRFESTHGGFLDGHTEGRGSSLVLPKFAHVWLSRDSEVHHKKPVDLHHFQFENKSREQHVADSSEHSLCLMKLLRDTAEGSTHNTHQHTHTHQHIVTHRPTHHHTPFPPYPPSPTRKRTCTCTCTCICICI